MGSGGRGTLTFSPSLPPSGTGGPGGGGGGGVEGRGRGTEDRSKLTRQVLGVGTVAFLLTLSYMLSRTPPLF